MIKNINGINSPAPLWMRYIQGAARSAGDRDAEGQAYLSFVSFEAFACQIAGLSEMWKRSLE